MRQARSSTSNENNQVAAFPQPPKERPDAKHHLKVSQSDSFCKLGMGTKTETEARHDKVLNCTL